MKSILIVAMGDSIHTARWLSQFKDQQLSVVVFPSGPHRHIHPLLRDLVVGNQVMEVDIAPMMKASSLPLYIADKMLPFGLRARYLRFLIKRRTPIIVHALETQHSGYIVSRAIAKLEKKPEFWLSLWGSDLVWFSRFRHHRKKIRHVLSKVDRLGIECKRDIDIARSFGFVGEILPIVPASGGMDLSETQTPNDFLAPSKRKKIVVKGYSGFVGRAPMALRALEMLAGQVMEYDVHIYSASAKTARLARRLAKKTGINFIIHLKHSLSHREVLSLFQEARLSISISLSDGFPGSLREAMVSGCFPVESLNSCGSEWAIQDESAIFVDPQNVAAVADAISHVLKDDKLVEFAAKINWELAQSRYSTSSLKELVDSYYLDPSHND
jgi:glycosyltransferase involved in cell wall biosynthesis